MLFLLAFVILVQGSLFGIVCEKPSIKKWLFLISGFATFLIVIFAVFQNNVGVWGIFAISHILLLFLYIHSYIIVNQKHFYMKAVSFKPVSIPAFFYLVPALLILSIGFYSVTYKRLVLMAMGAAIIILACIHNVATRKELKISIEQNDDLTKILHKSNVLIEIYITILSISVSLIYAIGIPLNGLMITLSCLVELGVNFFIFRNYYHSIKSKSCSKTNGTKIMYSIIVPKESGVGYTFNLENPIAVIIMIVLIIFLSLGIHRLSMS